MQYQSSSKNTDNQPIKILQVRNDTRKLLKTTVHKQSGKLENIVALRTLSQPLESCLQTQGLILDTLFIQRKMYNKTAIYNS